jgi:hypothetical protein
MTTNTNPFSFRLFLIGALLTITMARVSAAGLDFHLQLVWGTDEPKPADPRLQEIDLALKERFSGVFKWKNYYEVTNKSLKLPNRSGVETVKMSPKCELKVQSQGGSFIEVQFFGEGTLLRTVRQAVVPGELLVIAGDDVNDTAWFVVMTRVDPAAMAQWNRQVRQRLQGEGVPLRQVNELEKGGFEQEQVKLQLQKVLAQRGFSEDKAQERVLEVLQEMERMKKAPGKSL